MTNELSDQERAVEMDNAISLAKWWLELMLPQPTTPTNLPVDSGQLAIVCRAFLSAREELSDAKAALTEFASLDGHGCVTGDCPHERNEECAEYLREELQKLSTAARSALRGEGTGK